MRDGLLAQYMEIGFPHLRQVSGLPEWLVPDVAGVACKLGDQTILEIAEPLGLSERVKAFLAQAPEPDSLPVEIWQGGIGRWPAVHQVLPVAMALLRACEKVDALQRRGISKLDSSLVRSVAVISYAPFAPDRGEMLSRLANILGGSTAEPAGLLDRYIMAVVEGDNDGLSGVNRCILENPAWAEWSKRFLETGKFLPFIPKIVGIRPPLTSELMQVLVTMIMEVINADHSRDTRN